jgi:hypothetical protein
MEATGDSTFYKITKAHYGKPAFRVLVLVLEMLTMAALWILVSFLLERFIPFFRNGSLVEARINGLSGVRQPAPCGRFL